MTFMQTALVSGYPVGEKGGRLFYGMHGKVYILIQREVSGQYSVKFGV